MYYSSHWRKALGPMAEADQRLFWTWEERQTLHYNQTVTYFFLFFFGGSGLTNQEAAGRRLARRPQISAWVMSSTWRAIVRGIISPLFSTERTREVIKHVMVYLSRFLSVCGRLQWKLLSRRPCRRFLPPRLAHHLSCRRKFHFWDQLPQFFTLLFIL